MVVVDAFVSCDVSARASIRPSKAPSSLAPGLLGFCRKNSGQSQKSVFSSITFRLSTFVLAHTRVQHFLGSSTVKLPSILTGSGVCLLTQQYVRQQACACNDTLSGVLRQYHLPLAYHTLPKDTKLGVRLRRARRNRPDTTKLPPLVVGWIATWCHLSSVKCGFVHPSEKTLPRWRVGTNNNCFIAVESRQTFEICTTKIRSTFLV